MGSRPVLMAMAGATCIAFSAILVRLADVPPSTAAFYRCAYALPPLALLAWWERRRFGRLERRALWLSLIAGHLLHGRPRLLAPRHRRCRRRSRNGARKRPGGHRPAGRLGAPQREARRAARSAPFRSSSSASSSSPASSARAPTARTPRSASSSAYLPRSRTPASCSSSEPAAPTCAARPARSSTRRSRPRS